MSTPTLRIIQKGIKNITVAVKSKHGRLEDKNQNQS